MIIFRQFLMQKTHTYGFFRCKSGEMVQGKCSQMAHNNMKNKHFRSDDLKVKIKTKIVLCDVREMCIAFFDEKF